MSYAHVYRVDDLPVLQNRMFDSREAALASTKGDVELVQSLESGLVFNRAFKPELVSYDNSYQNEQGHSEAFQHHLDDVVAVISRHFVEGALVEVGCGKGQFLERLDSLGFDIVGLDPAYEGTNPKVRKELFTKSAGLRASGLILRHVLEHIPDPYAFLEGLCEANGGAGLIYIEVPCLDWIARRHAWFDIFYEHVNYFRLEDFERMFSCVLEAGRLFGSQYLYVVADLASLRRPVLRTPPFLLPEDFSAAVEKSAARVRRPGRESGTCVVWGGASKGLIFSLLMQRAGALIDTVIDVNPAKQGRFLAVTGSRVCSPEEILPKLPDRADIFVMNPNYLAEIRLMAGPRFNYQLVNNDDEV
jgi:SAM-dependent methyltransferase